MTQAGLPWDFALIFFVLGVVVPWRGAARIKQLLARSRLETADRLALYASTIAFQWLAVGAVAWRCSARAVSADRLGLVVPDPPLTFGLALGLCVALVANQIYSLRRLARVPPERHGFLHQMARKVMPQNLLESLAFVALVVTVALCEEFLYRGFVYTAIADATSNSAVVATIGSSAMFALAHLYQGRRGFAATFLVGVIFALARIWTDSLAPSISAHLLGDLVAGLLAPRMLAAATSEGSVPASRSPASPGNNQVS